VVEVTDKLGVADTAVCVGATQPAGCGTVHVAVAEPAPLMLEKGVLETVLPAESRSAIVKP